jgi:hypothetical protein
MGYADRVAAGRIVKSRGAGEQPHETEGPLQGRDQVPHQEEPGAGQGFRGRGQARAAEGGAERVRPADVGAQVVVHPHHDRRGEHLQRALEVQAHPVAQEGALGQQQGAFQLPEHRVVDAGEAAGRDQEVTASTILSMGDGVLECPQIFIIIMLAKIVPFVLSSALAGTYYYLR